MGPWTAGMLLALFPAGWVYNKLYKSTGGLGKKAFIGAAIVWLITVLIVGSILSIFI